MGRLLKIELPYPPSSNVYWRNFRGHVVKSQAARDYQTEVGLILNTSGIEQIDGDVVVKAWVYRPRKVGDLDNRLKVLFDAMQGHAYKNDSQIVEIHAYRRDDKKRPRVEIELERMPSA